MVGAALGVLVSISSVGAGAVGVTALLLLYPRLPMATIVGSDIAHAVPLTLVAGLGHWALGATDWHLMGVLLIGSLPGIVIGKEPISNTPMRCQSVAPVAPSVPCPATSVNGTACAMSEPTMRGHRQAADKAAEARSRPSRRRPTEEIATGTPSAAPTMHGGTGSGAGVDPAAPRSDNAA